MCAHTERCWLEPLVDLVSVAPTAAKRMAAQDNLQKLWLHGKAGGLCARGQLKAWALREAWMDGKEFATQAVGGDTDRVRTPAEAGR